MLEFSINKLITISIIATSVIMVYIPVIGIIIFLVLNLNFV